MVQPIQTKTVQVKKIEEEPIVVKVKPNFLPTMTPGGWSTERQSLATSDYNMLGSQISTARLKEFKFEALTRDMPQYELIDIKQLLL